ncbi:MAG TPA: PspC domain-containing protein [Streptosporangiaceae bacterium]
MNTTTAGTVTDQPAARQLRRSADDRMLAGVAGGIARYLDADVTLVRLIIAALALFSGAGVAALYLAAWLLIPQDGEDQAIAVAWIASHQNRSR